LWLIFTRRGIDIEKYPAIENYLNRYREQLTPGTGRKPGTYKWYEIQDNVAYWEEFEQPKIVIPAIINNVEYASDFLGYYSNDKTSICIAENVNYVLGILNSSLMWWFIQQIAASRQGGFFEFKPMYVSQIPIVTATESERQAIETLVQKCLEAKGKGVEDIEQEIDNLAYQLYGLTAEEIKIVERIR
jgi:adenine-specific DNA-methyltransferase